MTGSGYVRIYMPDHPAAKQGPGGGWVYEHRVVMERKLGRLLQPGELVDHIDRNRSNNAPENLQLYASNSAHVKDHFAARDQLLVARRRIAELEAELAKANSDNAQSATTKCADETERKVVLNVWAPLKLDAAGGIDMEHWDALDETAHRLCAPGVFIDSGTGFGERELGFEFATCEEAWAARQRLLTEAPSFRFKACFRDHVDDDDENEGETER